MKKLYNCNAQFDEKNFDLVSYSTTVIHIEFDDDAGEWLCAIYRASMTTMQHIRKYYEYLYNHNKQEIAKLIEIAYRVSIDEKGKRGTLHYNIKTGEIYFV